MVGFWLVACVLGFRYDVILSTCLLFSFAVNLVGLLLSLFGCFSFGVFWFLGFKFAGLLRYFDVVGMVR